MVNIELTWPPRLAWFAVISHISYHRFSHSDTGISGAQCGAFQAYIQTLVIRTLHRKEPDNILCEWGVQHCCCWAATDLHADLERDSSRT